MAAVEPFNPTVFSIRADGLVRKGESLIDIIRSMTPEIAPETILVHVDFRPSREVPDRQIQCGFFGSAEALVSAKRQSILQFKKDGETAFLFWPDGNVRFLTRQNGELKNLTLDAVSAAQAHIQRATRTLSLTSELRVREGVLFGMVRYLGLLKSEQQARDLVTEFLIKQDLTPTLRNHARNVLGRLNDSNAFQFADNTFNTERTSPKKKPKGYLDKKKKKSKEGKVTRNERKSAYRAEPLPGAIYRHGAPQKSRRDSKRK